MGRKRTNTGITLIELLVVVAVVGVIVVALSPLIRATRESARQHRCAENLRGISLALREYALKHEGMFPDDFSRLYPEYVDDPGVFICPSDMDASDIARDGADIDAATSYLYSRGWSLRDPLDTILACDKNDIFGRDTNHDGKGGNVMYLGGEVRWVDTGDWVPPVDKE